MRVWSKYTPRCSHCSSSYTGRTGEKILENRRIRINFISTIIFLNKLYKSRKYKSFPLQNCVFTLLPGWMYFGNYLAGLYFAFYVKQVFRALSIAS